MTLPNITIFRVRFVAPRTYYWDHPAQKQFQADQWKSCFLELAQPISGSVTYDFKIWAKIIIYTFSDNKLSEKRKGCTIVHVRPGH